eukprot:1161016-Pelagomonas_calceolata.AAC.6
MPAGGKGPSRAMMPAGGLQAQPGYDACAGVEKGRADQDTWYKRRGTHAVTVPVLPDMVMVGVLLHYSTLPHVVTVQHNTMCGDCACYALRSSYHAQSNAHEIITTDINMSNGSVASSSTSPPLGMLLRWQGRAVIVNMVRSQGGEQTRPPMPPRCFHQAPFQRAVAEKRLLLRLMMMWNVHLK